MASVYMVRALAEAGHVRLQLRRNRDTRALEYVAVRRLAESPMVPNVPHTCDPRGVARRMMKLLNKAAVTCRPCPTTAELADRKSVVSGQRVSVRVDRGGRRIIKKKTNIASTNKTQKQKKTKT